VKKQKVMQTSTSPCHQQPVPIKRSGQEGFTGWRTEPEQRTAVRS